jgi:hypothetical protein
MERLLLWVDYKIRGDPSFESHHFPTPGSYWEQFEAGSEWVSTKPSTKPPNLDMVCRLAR